MAAGTDWGSIFNAGATVVSSISASKAQTDAMLSEYARQNQIRIENERAARTTKYVLLGIGSLILLGSVGYFASKY